MIDLKPAANPLDVPSPKASEIVRNWPQAMWCHGATKVVDGASVAFCAIGILAEVGGYEWGEADHSYTPGRQEWDASVGRKPARFVGRTQDISAEELYQLACANDAQGKEAAADLLESWGK